MSPEAQQPRDPSLTAGNKLSDAPTLGEYVKGLLESEKIKAMPQHEQGRAIADRMIGAIVAFGSVEGSGAEYSVDDILDSFLELSACTSKESFVEAASYMTKNNGIRETAYALYADNRINTGYSDQSYEEAPIALGVLGESIRGLERHESGTLAFGSIDSLEAYLDIIKTKSDDSKVNIYAGYDSSNWTGDVVSEIKSIAERPGASVKETAGVVATDMARSENDYVKRAGLKAQAALSCAQRASANMDKIGRAHV